MNIILYIVALLMIVVMFLNLVVLIICLEILFLDNFKICNNFLIGLTLLMAQINLKN